MGPLPITLWCRFITVLGALLFALPPAGLAGVGQPSAVVIGISVYRDEAITDLSFAARDAELFGEFLRSPAGGFPARRVRVLTDSAATLAAIQAALAWQLEEAEADAKSLLYFAGHGDVETKADNQQGYLLAHDTPKNNYHLLALGLEYLNRHIARLSERGAQVVVVTDACHSGTLAGNSIGGQQITAAQLTRRLANEVKILSCQPYELAQEDHRWGGGRGAFSFFLVEGLRGAADEDDNLNVDLFELEAYLQREVRTTTGRAQHPEVSGGRRDRPFFQVAEASAAGYRAATRAELEKDFERSTVAASPPGSQASYVRFERALQRGRLVEPEQKAAAFHYRAIRSDTALTPLHGILRERLTIALLDAVQQAITAYLNTDAEELLQRERLDDKYRIFPAYLDTAAALLGAEDPRYEETLAKRDYFRGLVIRLTGERAGTRDTSLMRRALAHQEAAVIRAPRAAYLHNEIGMLRAHLGDNEGAIAAYTEAMRLSPTWALPANNIASLARNIDAQANFQFAEYYFQQAIRLKPDFPTAHMNYGNALLAVGRVAAAERSLRKALALGPEYADAYYNLGIALYRQDSNRREAIQLFREVLRRDSTDSAAHGALGHAYELAGRLDSAVAAYETSVTLRPDYDFGLGRLRTLHPALGRATAARRLIETTLRRYPGRPIGYYHLALLDTASGSWIKRLKEAPLDRSVQADVALGLGDRFLDAHHPVLAEPALRLAVRLRPDDPAVYRSLGTAYLRQARVKKALSAVDRALRRMPAEALFDYCGELGEATRFAPLREHPAYQRLLRRRCPSESPE